MQVEKFVQDITNELSNSSDVASRIIQKDNVKIGLICLKSMTSDQYFFDAVCLPIERFAGEINFQTLSHDIICTKEVVEVKKSEVVEKIVNGNVAIVTSNSDKILAIDILDFPVRTPSEPPTSQVLQGPREGFVEDLRTNITLLRRRFYSKDLVVKQMVVGKQTQTKIAITYLKSIASDDVVREVENKIKKIDIDGVIDSYYIIKKLENRPHSMFKQIGSIEKPDIVSAKMLEGRVAIIVDGSPIVLTVPYVILEDFQGSNDYYSNNFYASLIRVVRLIGVLVAIIAPGTYLAFRLFHFNVIPVKYLITIANTTLSLPFTPFVELLFINLLFQILYEVSLRLPSYLGLATSIVGALILGDTGVKAGLISPPGVIIIALSKIALYTVPEQSNQLTVLQLIFLIIGGTVGILGLIGGMIYIINYLNTYDSFGTPYLAPYSPKITSDLKDALFKSELNNMTKRPQSIKNKNPTRQRWKIQ